MFIKEKKKEKKMNIEQVINLNKIRDNLSFNYENEEDIEKNLNICIDG